MRTDIESILASHPGLVHRMRFVQLRFELRSSDDRVRIDVSGGHAKASMIARDAKADCEFVLEAPEAAWAEFAKPTPAPGYHDIVALVESRHAQLHGEVLGFFRNLFLVKGIVSAVFRGDARW